ncbi:MAG: F0F1 ATP synthase subunit B [Planctomycetes bacterium]|nr:F0F1 ATP synthase subunit B [Planctomycetota bacterium]
MRLSTVYRLCAVALLALLVSGAPVPAASAPAHAGDPVHDAEHGGKGGGLDFTGIKRYDLGIYTLIVFGILLFVLSKYAWPNIKAGLEKRESTILSALDEAKKDRAEAADLLARAKKELDATAAKVGAMLDEARKDAEALKAAKAEEGARDAQAERDRAKREVEADRAALTKDVQHQAVELAVLIATKALRQQVSVENQSRLLDESIAELKANANRA